MPPDEALKKIPSQAFDAYQRNRVQDQENKVPVDDYLAARKKQLALTPESSWTEPFKAGAEEILRPRAEFSPETKEGIAETAAFLAQAIPGGRLIPKEFHKDFQGPPRIRLRGWVLSFRFRTVRVPGKQ